MSQVVGVAALVLFLALVLLFIWVQRREPAAPDPREWKRELAEPWGSIVLGAFLIWPVVALVLGNRVLAVVMLAVVGLLIAIVSSLGVRRFVIHDDGIEWRTSWRRERLPLKDVVAVTDPDNLDVEPEVWLSGGRVLFLPDDPHVRLVMRSLATATSATPTDE
jgi:hypothetical protein